MDRSIILKQLNEIFIEVIDEDTIILTEVSTAKEVEGWDSLSHMLLITEVENNFSIKFKLKDLTKMKNVGDMLNIIISKS